MDTDRKVVVVTGASAGVGRAVAHRFAKAGYAVGLLARDVERLTTVRMEVESFGGEGLVLPADAARHDEVEEAAAAAERELGPIDVWVNNAMVSVFSPFMEMTPEEFQRVTDVTYHGFVHGTRAALKRMIPRDRGSIVQVGSALAYRGIPLQSAYCGAKHAIQGFMDSLRCELLHDRRNISLSMVQLPAVNTPQFSWVRSRLPNKPQPVPPIFQPEAIAEAIFWAARTGRREVQLGWPTILAIQANKFFPGLIDRYLAATGYRDQQTDEPVAPDRPDNLWKPVPGNFGARGEFSHRARRTIPEFWASVHRGGLAGAAAGFVVAGMIARRLRNGRIQAD